MKKSISIPEWHEMAQKGEAPSMRVLIQGNSMFPLVRKNRDYVTIQPLEGTPGIGDIVMFSDPQRENRFVLHRVWRIEQKGVLTWGDNCLYPDQWMPLDAVWGKATLIERGRRAICPDPRRGLRLARFWHVAGRGWRLARRIKRKLCGALTPKKMRK